MTVCVAMVAQLLNMPRRCKETVPVNKVPLAVRVPVIEKGVLTLAEGGAAMVRAVVLRGCASTTALALQNNNPQITSSVVATSTPFFSANTPPHLER